jgi:Na+/glutamate symporter
MYQTNINVLRATITAKNVICNRQIAHFVSIKLTTTEVWKLQTINVPVYLIILIMELLNALVNVLTIN